MNRLRWLILLPLLIVLVVFAVNNREPIPVSLWPLDITVVWPAFVFVFVPAAIAFLLGGAAMWASDHSVRKLARQRRRRIEELEREAASLRARLDQTGERGVVAPPPAPPMPRD